MSRKKLANIQWQFIRYSIWICLISGILVMFVLFFNETNPFDLMIEKKLWLFPILIIVPLICIVVGACFGYVIGNLVKKRLEVLVQSTMALERGNFAHRTIELGDDEIGLMGKHLNVMAERVEDQVASLQRLSSERAEWNETLKQAAVNEERQRLARELHDAVSQQLFAISMMTSALPHSLNADLKKAKSQIGMIEKMATTAQAEMRALLLHLRPAHLEGKKLKQGIEDLLIELETKHGLTIKWKIEDVEGLAKGIEDHLFRIIQEAISNTLRHAKANSLFLQLQVINEQIRLKIIDDGIGFEPSDQKSTSSYGLNSMNERTNEIGGVLEVISLPGKGTQIEVKVPIVKNIGGV
ncbi:HAMP domain-containing sensor histidine kinase [Anaerobacillus sp. MEB173]|uniref:HAMP domain-containing sensor histidine kinase n=1 Tax=Anaerobacillus sp. MEB173 TaxID=3383345 RepID=UPI003F917C9A